jgi:hypothetical protein
MKVLSREEIRAEPIDPNLKACILGELAMAARRAHRQTQGTARARGGRGAY